MSMERSERCEFVGAHVTPEVKSALETEARNTSVSMSYLVYSLLVEALRKKKEHRLTVPAIKVHPND